jgi:hypothetical protein
MVLCPPHPAQPSGTALNPDPGLGAGPASPFPDLEPGPDRPAPVPSTATRAAPDRPEVMPGHTRPRRKRKRVVIAAAIPAALALAVVVPRSWWPAVPSRLPSIHVTRPVPPRAAISPKNVIHQARARQRHRRQRIMRDLTIGSGSAHAARSFGSPPRHRPRSHVDHAGQPPPAPGAEALPGLAALDHGQGAHVSSLSCPSAGNCAIIGFYGNHWEGFLDSEVSGRWHKARQIPGLAALAPGGYTYPNEVMCSSTGNCQTLGSYRAGFLRWAAFQVTEHDGIWGKAQPIPGLPTSEASGFVLSCSSAGNCAISGTGTLAARSHARILAFVDSEINGKWGKAQQVPGQAKLGDGASFAVTAISCTSPGNCAIAGTYHEQANGDNGGYVASETDGVWGAAQQIRGAPASPAFDVTAISCASAGNCGLAGSYNGPDGRTRWFIPFVVSQVNGTWGNAEPVPGLAALGVAKGVQLVALSCPAPGECTAAGGYYHYPSSNDQQAFTVTETGGTWGTAEKVPGTAARHIHGTVNLGALSCSSAGNCSAGGQVGASGTGAQAFTITQTGGTWHTARYVPGITTLTPTGQRSMIEDMSCPPAGPCSAAGYYGNPPGWGHIFVVG